MTEADIPVVDPSWRRAVRWGGASLSAAALVLVVFIVAVFAVRQPMPPTAQAILQDPTVPIALFVLAALGELFLMPAALGLYVGLRRVARAPMLVAAGLMLTAVPMFLASRCLIVAVGLLSEPYLGSSGGTMEAAYLAAAELALEAQTALSATALILLSVSSVFVGAVMLRARFAGRLGYVAIGGGAARSVSWLLGVAPERPWV